MSGGDSPITSANGHIPAHHGTSLALPIKSGVFIVLAGILTTIAFLHESFLHLPNMYLQIESTTFLTLNYPHVRRD